MADANFFPHAVFVGGTHIVWQSPSATYLSSLVDGAAAATTMWHSIVGASALGYVRMDKEESDLCHEAPGADPEEVRSPRPAGARASIAVGWRGLPPRLIRLADCAPID